MASMKFDGAASPFGLRQPRAGLVEEAGKPGADTLESEIEAAVRGQLHIAPVRHGGEEPAADPGQDDFELALNDVARLFDRVDVVAEDDEHRDVDREAFELLHDVQRLARVRRPFEAALEPLRHHSDFRVERADMTLRKRRDGRACAGRARRPPRR